MTPFYHPHSAQRRPAEAHAVGLVLGPHARTNRTRDTRVAETRLPAPKDEAVGGGTAPDTRRPSQRWQATPPLGPAPTTPTARSPRRACKPRGQCWAPTPAHSRPQHVGGGPRQPAQRAGSWGRGSAQLHTPLTTAKGAPHGDTLQPPPQRATPARKGGRREARAGSPRPPTPTAPGTHGSRNPGCPLQGTGGREGDSA